MNQVEKMIQIAAFRPKRYSYITNDDDENKKAKGTKKCVKKKKTRLITRNCLEVIQLENKINQIEKNILDVHSLRENYKEFINKGKLILK